MHLHKEIYGANVQENVESITKNFENIDAAVSSKSGASSSGDSFSTIKVLHISDGCCSEFNIYCFILYLF